MSWQGMSEQTIRDPTRVQRGREQQRSTEYEIVGINNGK